MTLALLWLSSSCPAKGGAIHVAEGGNLNVSHCTFSENEGKQGGAMYMYDTSRAWVWHSTFSQNRAQTQGGAIMVHGQLETYDCRFVANVGGLNISSSCDMDHECSVAASALQVEGHQLRDGDASVVSRGDTFEDNLGAVSPAVYPKSSWRVSPAVYVTRASLDLQGCTMSRNEGAVSTPCCLRNRTYVCLPHSPETTLSVWVHRR